MATYSVYNIKVDNLLSFTPGPTAGYVLAIDSNGNTYWSAGGSGGSGSSGSNGTSGSSGTSGNSGSSGSSGTSGLSGSNGTSGSSGTSGVNGQNGQSSSLFLYKAKTTTYTGNPDNSYILWNNATQTGATAIHINHLTKDNLDIDVFLGLIKIGSNLVIQHQTNSNENQTWLVNGTPTLVASANNYWIIPVSLVNSTASFGNNDDLVVALTAESGTSGSSGVNGATGPSGGGTLAQTLALGNSVGTYSITSPALSDINLIPGSGGSVVISNPVGNYIAVGQGTIIMGGTTSFFNDIILPITSSLLATDASGIIIATSSTGGSSGTSGVNGATGPAGSGGGGGSVIRLSNQTLSTSSWNATGSYYGYTFSNANIGTSSNVDFIPYNDYSFTVLAAGVQPYILPLSGSAIIYSQYIPSASIVGDFLITPTI